MQDDVMAKAHPINHQVLPTLETRREHTQAVLRTYNAGAFQLLPVLE